MCDAAGIEVPPARPRLALLHATPVAIAATHDAFSAHWPEAELVDLLDTGLTLDRARTATLSVELIDRFVALAGYGHKAGAKGILATCSAFGPAIERADETLPIPVVKPNAAMFCQALTHGGRIAMLATFSPAVDSMSGEFFQIAGANGHLNAIVVDDAMDALRRGDTARHNQLIAERAADLVGYDAIMLAHFSTSRAAATVRLAVDTPVITAPESAVLAIRAAMGG